MIVLEAVSGKPHYSLHGEGTITCDSKMRAWWGPAVVLGCSTARLRACHGQSQKFDIVQNAKLCTKWHTPKCNRVIYFALFSHGVFHPGHALLSHFSFQPDFEAPLITTEEQGRRQAKSKFWKLTLLSWKSLTFWIIWSSHVKLGKRVHFQEINPWEAGRVWELQGSEGVALRVAIFLPLKQTGRGDGQHVHWSQKTGRFDLRKRGNTGLVVFYQIQYIHQLRSLNEMKLSRIDRLGKNHFVELLFETKFDYKK